MVSMIPDNLKVPFWLIPACILSMTVGLYLIIVLIIPGFNPYLMGRLEAMGFVPIAVGSGLLCFSLPILLLWVCVKNENNNKTASAKEDD